MLSEKVTILARDAGTLTLKSQRKSTCTACSMRKGCGQYLLLADDESFSIDTSESGMQLLGVSQGMKAGDMVNIEVGEQALMRLTALFYLVPLGTMIAGLGLATLVFSHELPLIIASAISFGGGILLSRYLLKLHYRHHAICVRPLQAEVVAAENFGVCL